jgi:hypothetical protein
VKAAVESELAAEAAAADAAAVVQLRLDSIAKISESQFSAESYIVSAVAGATTYFVKNIDADADKLTLIANGGASADADAIAEEVADNWSTTEAGAILLSKTDAGIVDTNSTAAVTITYQSGSADQNDLELTNGVVDLYIGAAKTVSNYDKAVTKLNAAVAAVSTARSDTTELAALEKEVTTSKKVLTDAGYAVTALSNGAFVVATAKDDVFTLGTLKADGDKATINDFSFAGNDVIAIGSSYTFNAGKMATAGDDAVLEVFAVQSGANVILSFETTKFGSNVTPLVNDADITAVGGDQLFSVTLTGVALADVSISNGFVQLA